MVNSRQKKNKEKRLGEKSHPYAYAYYIGLFH